jgi:phosphatidylinositol phospholipase C delta
MSTYPFVLTFNKETDADIDYAKQIIAACEHKKKKKEGAEPVLTAKGLNAYMANVQYNSAFDPKHQKLYQDMSQPFPHYFIASSHNT